MDKRIYLFFAVVFVLAAGTFSFRYASYEPCVDVDFTFDQLQPKAGAPIQFNDKTLGAKKWEWDFGDKTATKSQKNERHIFEEPGFYEVTLKVNGSCEMTKPIYVEANTKVLDPSKFPQFNLPSSIRVGETLTVTDKSKIAETWEWRFGESIKVDATTKRARHVYRRPGTYTVSLIINDEIENLVKKTIRVRPKKENTDRISGLQNEPTRNILNLPDAPEPDNSQTSTTEAEPELKEIIDEIEQPEEKVTPPPVVVEKEKNKEEPKDVRPILTEKIITDNLRLIAKNRMTPQDFAKYFCDEYKNPFVTANGKAYTFDRFCKIVKGKNVIMKRVVFGSDKKCVYSFEINFSR